MIVEKLEHISLQFHVPLKQLLKDTCFSYASFMRWKGRMKRGLEPAQTPGPKKVETFDLNNLQEEVKNLNHRRKRTHQTAAVYERYKHCVSRRTLGSLIAEARRTRRKQQSEGLQRLRWHHPGLAWALDDAEHQEDPWQRKLFMCSIQDLCSRYKLPPLAGSQLSGGEELSGHLDRLFRQFGAPLFLKRDNHGNLNHSAVNETLEHYMVIPLNSPVNYAQYNGAIEHTQSEMKYQLKSYRWKASAPDELELLAEIGAHDLNHKPRRSLNGRNSCTVFHSNGRMKFNRRYRKEVFEWIKDLSFAIMEKLGDRDDPSVAWRIAARTWLQKNNHITIVKNGKVLPCYEWDLCHN
ncbi:hypothetical protein ACFL43_00900 [Thermodesulfobacteriota bacterium]